MTGRSPEARKRRARTFGSGRRIACETCHLLHPPPECDSAEAVRMTVDLPPHVARELKDRIQWGERSPWIVRLIRRELEV